MPLVLTHAEAHIPVSQISGGTWDSMVAARQNAPDISNYEGLMQLLENEFKRSCLPEGYRTLSDGGLHDANKDILVPVSNGPTQADMASDVVARLCESFEVCDNPIVPALMTYASTAVDENFFASVVGRVAAEHKLSKKPHFGVWQMQGAALAASLEIASAMVNEPGQAAILVASEKWPLPSDRKVPGGGLLGDGACAVRAQLCDGNETLTHGLVVRAARNISTDPFVSGAGTVPDREKIISKLCEEVTHLLGLHPDLDPDAVIWLPSDFGLETDKIIAAKVGGSVQISDTENRSNTNFCCASGHLAVSRILTTIQQSLNIPNGQCFIQWGVSFGGNLGISLLQLQTQEKL